MTSQPNVLDIAPPLARRPAGVQCAFRVDELPVAALVCGISDRRVLAVNRCLAHVLGEACARLTGRAVEEIILEPCDAAKAFGSSDALLARADGHAGRTLMIAFPVQHAGECAVVCVFPDVPARAPGDEASG